MRALRELSVAAVGRLPSELEPVRTDPIDPWDLRYLGEAIDLTRRLDTLSRSFTVLGTELDPDDLRRLLPSLDGEPVGRRCWPWPVGRARPSSGLPSPAAPAREVVVPERWDSVFSFRDDGGRLGPGGARPWRRRRRPARRRRGGAGSQRRRIGAGQVAAGTTPVDGATGGRPARPARPADPARRPRPARRRR